METPFEDIKFTAKRPESRLAIIAGTIGSKIRIKFLLREKGKKHSEYSQEFPGTYSWYKAIKFGEENDVNTFIFKKAAELMKEHNITPEEVYCFMEKYREKRKVNNEKLRGTERNRTYQREYRKLYRRQDGVVTPEQLQELKHRLNHQPTV